MLRPFFRQKLICKHVKLSLVIIMEYKIYFVKQAFKEVINKNFFINLMDKKNDTFFNKQFQYLFYIPTFEQIMNKCREYFKERDDVIIYDRTILFMNTITKVTSHLIYEDNLIKVTANNEDDVLILFLHACFDSILVLNVEEVGI